MNRTVVHIGGTPLTLSNLGKELYPAAGFTKAHVLEYYRRMAPVILPHLRDRALTLKRYPDGVEGEFFFEKRCPAHRPAWVQTAGVSRAGREEMTACLANDPATLLWVANLASLELHVPLARACSPETPDTVVFDLDPGPPATVLDCARVALILGKLLTRLGLTSLVKTSGNKGLHLLVPLNSPDATFDRTKQFSRAVALALEKNYPELVTAAIAKNTREGKVFINWSQNDPSLTTICVYSLRAREEPFVSFPLSWQDLDEGVSCGNPARLRILAGEAMDRAEREGDLFAEVLTTRQQLPHI